MKRGLGEIANSGQLYHVLDTFGSLGRRLVGSTYMCRGIVVARIANETEQCVASDATRARAHWWSTEAPGDLVDLQGVLGHYCAD